jgi:hypothetical protein
VKSPPASDRRVNTGLLRCCGVVLLLVIAKSSCVAAASSGVTRDDLAVFRAVLSSACQRADRTFYVISDLPISTKGYPAPADWPANLPWTDLAASVPSGVRWPHIEICAANRIVDHRKVDAIFERDASIRSPPGWDPFYVEFPGAKGLMRISVPAFTSDGRHAVIYLETTCNVMCGSGFYIELVRGKRGWKVSHRETAWIS